MRNVIRHSVRAIALIALTGTVVSAQSWSGSFKKQSPAAGATYAGYGVGPYNGELYNMNASTPANVLADITTANTGFSFWCVDGVGTFGNDLTVKVFSLATVGDAGLQAKLAKAAFVTHLYGVNGVSGGAAMSNYNAAIWTIMGSTTPFAINDAAAVNSYIAEAEAGYGAIDLNSFYYVQFDDNNLYMRGGSQELLFQGSGQPFIVPEPGSFALMAGGLLLFAGVRRRRSRG